MSSQKETVYILNKKTVSDFIDITEIERRREIFWYHDDIGFTTHPQIFDIKYDNPITRYDGKTGKVIDEIVCDCAIIINKISGEQKKITSQEDFKAWRNNLTLEEFLNTVIEIYYSSYNGIITKEYSLEKQGMLRPTEKRKAKLYHLEILDRETETVIEETSLSGYKASSNYFYRFKHSHGYETDNYIFLLNGIDITDVFDYDKSLGKIDMYYCTTEPFDKSEFTMKIKK